jgi:hypothetical protein
LPNARYARAQIDADDIALLYRQLGFGHEDRVPLSSGSAGSGSAWGHRGGAAQTMPSLKPAAPMPNARLKRPRRFS